MSDRVECLAGDDPEASSDTRRLLSRQGIAVRRSDALDISPSSSSPHPRRLLYSGCAYSLPVNLGSIAPHQESLTPGDVYGSVCKGMDPDCESKRIVYCVHGKPGGCCATVLDGQGQPSNTQYNIPIPPEEHCHTRQRRASVDDKARKQLITASVLCVVFMIGEVIGGYLSKSLAIATDAAHLLTDFASFMISLFALWVAQRKPTKMMLFGWHRAEVIGALTSVLTIWLVTGILVYLAIERCIYMDFEIEANIMLITSGVGVIVNIIMGFTLHQHGHSHGGHSHASAPCPPSNTSSSIMADLEGTQGTHPPKKNINVRAAFIHVIGDLIQSVGVFIAALIIYFQPSWKIVDPVCTFLFSILVLLTTFSIMRDTLIVLMEGIPRDINFNEVLNTFLCIEGVVAVHNLRIWALSLGKTALAAHIAITPGADPQAILQTASKKVHAKYHFFEMTLQIEDFQPNMENCSQCQMPT